MEKKLIKYSSKDKIVSWSSQHDLWIVDYADGGFTTLTGTPETIVQIHKPDGITKVYGYL